jgi:hypothetical protein
MEFTQRLEELTHIRPEQALDNLEKFLKHFNHVPNGDTLIQISNTN